MIAEKNQFKKWLKFLKKKYNYREIYIFVVRIRTIAYFYP